MSIDKHSALHKKSINYLISCTSAGIYIYMFKNYLTQLKEIAENTGWELREACMDAGIADTTYYRWIQGTTTPREKQAQTVANYMVTYTR